MVTKKKRKEEKCDEPRYLQIKAMAERDVKLEARKGKDHDITNNANFAKKHRLNNAKTCTII